MKFAIAAVLAATVAASWDFGHGLGLGKRKRVDFGHSGVDARYARSQIKGRGGRTYVSDEAAQYKRGGYGAIGYGKGLLGMGKFNGGYGRGLRDATYSHGGYVQTIGHRDGRSYTTNWSSAGYGKG